MAASLTHFSNPGEVQITVRDTLDCATAALRARDLAAKIGFLPAQVEEIVLAASELAHNLVKHAGQGVLTLRAVAKDDYAGLEILSDDEGPGMTDVVRSLSDGYSSSGTLGYGLGTVNRFMDDMEIESESGFGTHIRCQRWLRKPQDLRPILAWDVAAASRSRRLAPDNGDAFVIHRWSENMLVGLIDGLGHGPLAQQAAVAAQNYIRDHYDLPLDRIFAGVGRSCKGTRGVVMCLVRFENSKRIQFAALGNIEARICCGPVRMPFAMPRGIVGMDEARVKVQTHDWDPNWLLVLHTDGLSERWQWDQFSGLEREPADVIAQRLLRDLKPRDDDATVLVAKGPKK